MCSWRKRGVCEAGLSGFHSFGCVATTGPLTHSPSILFSVSIARYGYGAVCDAEATTEAGLPFSGAIAKFRIPQSSADPLCHPIFHKYKKGEFGGEAVFVAREAGETEDDGWLVTFVHNVELDCSFFYIIDARDMEGEPVAKIRLPQRVPWGLHGLFVPAVGTACGES